MRFILVFISFFSFHLNSFSQQWETIYENDFEGNVSSFTPNYTYDFIADIQDSTVYSSQEVIQNNGFNSTVLGSFGGEDTVNFYMFTELEVDSIRIEYDLFIHDSWDGNTNPDIFRMEVNDSILLNATFSNIIWDSENKRQSYPNNYNSISVINNFPGYGSDLYISEKCSHNGTFRYKISKIISLNENYIDLNLGTPNLDNNLCDESWSIDNFKISLHSYICSDTSSTEVIACESYEWNGETYTESGTYDYSGLESNNNYSMNFDNSNIELPSTILQSLNSFSFSAYVYADENQSGFSNIFQQDPGSSLAANIRYQNDMSTFKFLLDLDQENTDNYVAITADVPNINQWYYVTMTYDGQTMSAYIDDNLVGSGILSGNFSSFNAITYIGNWQLEEGFDGQIDNVQIWDKALSLEEIQGFINCYPNGDELGLIGYWNFEEGEGNTTYDLSGNGNDGIINGATYSTNTPNQSCQLTNVNGCDSVAILNLTIAQLDTSFTEVTSCESYQWNGQTYTESGTYEYVEIGNIHENSIFFDGINDEIKIQHNEILNLGNSFSISTYVKWNGINDENSLFQCVFDKGNSNNNNYTLRINNLDGKISFVSDNDAESSLNSLATNEWTHITVTYSQNEIKFYFNGILDYSSTFNVDAVNFDDLTIGNTTVESDNSFFNGNISYLHILDYELSLENIQQNIYCPPTGSESGLVGYWNFEEGEGNTVYDLSGNGNDGTINGATYSTDVPEQSCQLTTINGCDSVAVLNLTIIQPDTSFTEVAACESYEWNGQTFIESGSYVYNENDVSSIDNFTFLGTYENSHYYISENVDSWTNADSICNSLNGHLVTFSNETENNFVDSLVYLYSGDAGFVYNIGLYQDLNGQNYFEPDGGWKWVNNEVFAFTNWRVNEPNEASFGENYGSNSIFANNPGWNDGHNGDVPFVGAPWNYVLEIPANLTTVSGCDSVAVLNLTIYQPDTSFTEITACESYEWNGETYTESGVYTNTYTNANGCDSTHTLNLTINNSISSNTEASSCSSYEWNGMIYENSGTYEFDTLASNGCDSTAVLELEICYLDQLEINGPTAAVTSTTSSFSVQDNTGSAFIWSIEGLGTISSGQYTNEIFIDWSEIEGITSVCVYEKYDCSGLECLGDTVCLEVDLKRPAGVVENNLEVNIYPNPSSNIFNLEFNSDYEAEILVANILGEQFYFESIKSIGEFNTQIDLSNYSKGVYNLTIKTSDGISNHKLILQ